MPFIPSKLCEPEDMVKLNVRCGHEKLKRENIKELIGITINYIPLDFGHQLWSIWVIGRRTLKPKHQVS